MQKPAKTTQSLVTMVTNAPSGTSKPTDKDKVYGVKSKTASSAGYGSNAGDMGLPAWITDITSLSAIPNVSGVMEQSLGIVSNRLCSNARLAIGAFARREYSAKNSSRVVVLGITIGTTSKGPRMKRNEKEGPEAP